jgi:hypothetical protein
MPGLVRGVARTAVVAGTATAVSNRVSRRQANRWSEQSYAEQSAGSVEQPPPPPAPSGTDQTIAQLKQLGELRDSGVLTDAEFEAQKAKILAG